MSKEKAIEKIQYAAMQIVSVYPCSAIFDKRTNVTECRQKELEKAVSICMMHLKSWRMNNG